MIDWDDMVDCEGLLCPLPVLRARKRLLALAPGGILCVRAIVNRGRSLGRVGHHSLGNRDHAGIGGKRRRSGRGHRIGHRLGFRLAGPRGFGGRGFWRGFCRKPQAQPLVQRRPP
jgi:tRNA 2-thiouridine synthesizing protein A